MAQYQENFSLAEVASMIADSILEEKMLSKESIITKILAYAKSFSGIKQDPTKKPNPAGLTRSQRNRIRAEAQAQYWHDIVRKLCNDYDMLTHYSNRDKMLKEKGFNVFSSKK